MTRYLLTFTSILSTGLVLAGDPPSDLAESLKPLAPYVGKTWKGAFVGAAKPTSDVSRWERALNGKAVRVLHSVNDGAYGGETIIMWDAKRKSLAYWYFTTAGFRAEGTMKIEDGALIGHETVTGNQQGVTEVRSTTRLLDDGRMHVKSEYLKNGEWVKGTERYYKEAPEARVVFK